MISTYYTFCKVIRNQIFYRGVENGRRVQYFEDYYPTLFVKNQQGAKSKHKDIYGNPVSPIKPGTIKETKDWIRQYDGISNFGILGNQNYHYTYLSDKFPGKLDYTQFDSSHTVIANIDIETSSSNGFPEPDVAREPIISIAVKANNHFTVFGCNSYIADRKDVTYVECEDEKDLIEEFLAYWEKLAPDIITGWNIQYFDIPYLVNRITKVLGEKAAKRLSPSGYLSSRENEYYGKVAIITELMGISTLDYQEIYRKYVLEPRESYSLNYISSLELGEKKISYEEQGNLQSLYENDFQKFIDYNIKDVELVDKLEKKLRLIEMMMIIAYSAKVNFADCLAQTRLVDSLIFNFLRSRDRVVPEQKVGRKDEKFRGAHVKPPIRGAYHYIATLDAKALYPSLIIQNNISPDTISDEYKDVEIEDLIDKKYDLSYLKEKNLSLCANGHHFDISTPGFLAEILMEMVQSRDHYKSLKIENEKKLEEIEIEMKRRGIAV